MAHAYAQKKSAALRGGETRLSGKAKILSDNTSQEANTLFLNVVLRRFIVQAEQRNEVQDRN